MFNHLQQPTPFGERKALCWMGTESADMLRCQMKETYQVGKGFVAHVLQLCDQYPFYHSSCVCVCVGVGVMPH